MFDPITSALIRSAPALDGLNLQDLPKQLTEAFAQVVSARIRTRTRSAGEGASQELKEKLATLRRLAATHEAYAALLADRQNRAAAAFVAASAHQAFIQGEVGNSSTSQISAASLSPEICSSLLFLIAEAHTDAAEAAKRIRFDNDSVSPVEKALLIAIRDLAQARLRSIANADIPEMEGAADDMGERALQALQLMLLQGVKKLAAQLLRRSDPPSSLAAETAAELFLRVKQLCSEPITGVLESGDPVYSIYPGPLHLANLLLGVERDLVESALTRIPTPGGVDEAAWWNILRRIARQRPFLWRNHREAITKGYLQHGTSSAISFPTGGGKSTLAELEIATSLLRGEKVVFLAPTNALVGQTARALKNTFQSFEVLGDIADEATFAEIIILPEVTVTTPERCLMMLSIQPEAFENLGLIVFDECHLLHPRDEDRSRRGLDAMLTILNLTRIAPQADLLLLSAMMKNTSEVAGWLKHLTGRECLTLDLAWKPTRQVRGCVVFPAEQIDSLNVKLAKALSSNPGQASLPAAVGRTLLAQPFGLFSLLQTWSTTNREDYALLPLLTNPVILSTGKRKSGGWYLTPNGNQTSGAIAAAAVAGGMKTLVFVQTTVFCEACVRDFPSRLETSTVRLTEEEQKWRRLSVEEMGGAEYCFLRLEEDGTLKGGAASHHSLLLREERELHESLFRRRDGIGVLFATSTLAQGMNLPSEVVIISGDSRFDPGADKMKKLEAHELLNAAGRAGRAGEGAEGFVLLVPSKVIGLDDQKNEISSHWMELQSIFEQADQCLDIDDPMTAILDQIHDGMTKSGTPAYLLAKLPIAVVGASEDPAFTLLSRSFAAYRAKLAGDDTWIKSRIDAAMAARPPVDLPEKDKWIEHISGSTGVRIKILQELLTLADANRFGRTSLEIVESLFAWLDTNPVLLMEFVRPESLEALFGEKYKKLENDNRRSKLALPFIKSLWLLWMSGAPLCKLEAAFLGPSVKLGRCEHARQFVSRIVPDLAFLAGLPARLLVARNKSAGDPSSISAALGTLGSVVREGCESAESYAARKNCGPDISRVAAKNHFDEIKEYIQPGDPAEDFETTRQRLKDADALWSFVSS